jgi:nitroreductase
LTGHDLGRVAMQPMKLWFLRWFLLAAVGRVQSGEDVLKLPPPRTTGGTPLLTALSQRQTTREFKTNSLDPQCLSDLLWAAFGVNRPATGGRTAPSAMNAQEIDLYLAAATGLFRFDPKAHQLDRVVADDLRPLTSGQEFARAAPVTLVFVADLARLPKARPEQREFYAGIDTGYISQNVYLFCASAGLGTVVHDLDRAPLAKAARLGPDQRIILAQAVGFPAAP